MASNDLRKRPSHTLLIIDKQSKKRRTAAGVLFKNEWGGYALVLSPGIVLTAEMQEKYWLSCYNLEEPEHDFHEEIPF